MIASVQGEVIAAGEDNLVVSVGGVGLLVYVFPSVRAEARMGERLFLHTYLVVREDALALYGFEHEEERSFFLLLLGVNGVGPRLAMSILAHLSVDAIRRAVLNEQPDIFGRVPGVGKKTGQKIILHLQGKVGEGMTSGVHAVQRHRHRGAGGADRVGLQCGGGAAGGAVDSARHAERRRTALAGGVAIFLRIKGKRTEAQKAKAQRKFFIFSAPLLSVLPCVSLFRTGILYLFCIIKIGNCSGGSPFSPEKHRPSSDEEC